MSGHQHQMGTGEAAQALGIDDHQAAADCGSVIFKVYLDNVLAYTFPVQTVVLPPLPFTVGNATILKLALKNPGDGICGDLGDWGNTRLYLAPSADAQPSIL